MTETPDPGLTDLIAAHREVMRWNDFAYPPLSTTPYRATSVTEMVNCSCGESMTVDSFPAHVALVVEQHTNGRIAETVKSTGQRMYAQTKKWQERAETAEATIVRVITALEAAEKSVPDDWGVTYIYTSQLRAALEGEQQ